LSFFASPCDNPLTHLSLPPSLPPSPHSAAASTAAPSQPLALLYVYRTRRPKTQSLTHPSLPPSLPLFLPPQRCCIDGCTKSAVGAPLCVPRTEAKNTVTHPPLPPSLPPSLPPPTALLHRRLHQVSRWGFLYVYRARRRPQMSVPRMHSLCSVKHEFLREAWGGEEVSGGGVSEGSEGEDQFLCGSWGRD